MSRILNLTFAACAILAVPAAAQTQRTLVQDAAAFGARESAHGVNLSPSGRLIAYIAPAPNSGTVAMVSDLTTGETKGFLNAGKGPEHLSWCKFVTDERLICRYRATLNEAGILVGFSRLIAINRDGTDMQQLGQGASFYDAGLRQVDGDIIDWLPGEGGSVLMSREYVPEINRTGTRMGRSKEGLSVERLDTRTLKRTVIEAPKRDIQGYMSDGRGNVRLMSKPETNNDGLLTGRMRYEYRAAGSDRWQPLMPYVDPDDFLPLEIDGTTNQLYVLKPLNGRQALYRMTLSATPSEQLVASHPRVDIDQVIRSGNGQHVIGYGFSEDKRQAVYFDREYDALADALGKAIPNLPLIEFVNSSADSSKLLMFAGSDNDPGRYYVFDKTAKKLEEIFLARPELEHVKLASVKPVTVKSSDGVAIPAYLTLPPGKEAKGLPAVVLPHGGPSSRDDWGFDWIAQFLAARGYAVIQPNYRGSAGFGDAWLLDNGFKSWSTSIGDIMASAKWMASEGIADPNRMAVVGWSYGGYAALQSGVVDPTLFKAIVAIAPVTDLAMLKKEAEDYTNRDVIAEFVGTGPHIEQGSPLRHASKIKAPVLLAHGTMDQNVGVAHSDRMAGALRNANVPVEVLRYDDLDHQLNDTAARRQLLTKTGELLDRTIGR